MLTKAEHIGKFYEHQLEHRVANEQLMGHFMNFGYWKADTKTHLEACENLVELTAASLPRDGELLEIGCGLGGVINYLTRHYPAARLTGINILEQQLEVCRRLVPGARFIAMNAMQLEFPDDHFNSIISIEAAFHFPSRQRFLTEALRVLKPGGYVAIVDQLGPGIPPRSSEHIETPSEYEGRLRAIGFEEVRVTDITTESLFAHADFMIAYLRQRLAAGEIDERQFASAAMSRVLRVATCKHYLIARCRKPFPNRPAWSGALRNVVSEMELEHLILPVERK